MKKILHLTMVLGACLVFSPQPAFAAPDTGPKVDNIEVNDHNSASANLIMPEQGVFQVSITNNYFSTAVQASGQETVLHRSDHSVATTHYILNKKVFFGSESSKLVNVGKYDGEHPRAWCDRRSCASNMRVNISDNLKEHATGLASMAALHPRLEASVMRRPAWMAVPLRC